VQNVDGRPEHKVGVAEGYEGGRILLKLTQASEAGRVAKAMLEEQLLDVVVEPDRSVRLGVFNSWGPA
jgi:hypothetical protein